MAVATISKACAQPTGFVKFLEEQFESKPFVAPGNVPRNTTLRNTCRCSFNKRCRLHLCKCRLCQDGAKMQCRWRASGKAFLKAKAVTLTKAKAAYRKCARRRGIQIDPAAGSSPRIRANLGALYAVAVKQGQPASNLVADISQTIHMTGCRTDGKLPTVTCHSQLWAFPWGRALSGRECFFMMGWRRSADFGRFSDSELRRLAGNSMHVAVVGTLIGSGLSLLN
jgi:hypothetical protein